MNIGKTVFTQILDHLPRYEFNRCVKRYNGNYRVRRFSCYDQFLCLAFAQLTYRESLRDIETCLNSHREKLYHVGFRGQVSKSTLADAGEVRDYRIYQDFAVHLMSVARRLYQNETLAVELDYSLYALDSTIIDLCLALFPWALFNRIRGAVKIHTLLDLKGSIPTFISLTPGIVNDVNILDILPLEKDAVIAMDLGYIDFARLYAMNLFPAFFVIRARKNLCFRRLDSQQVDKTSGLRSDQRIVLTGKKSRAAYPEALRRVSYRDIETNKRFVFLTNIFAVPAKTVADIYRQRWQIELFFRWIKQHLRIKSFFGTSPNAVKTQIWIAISIYLLVAILKKRLHLPGNLHTILQILEVNIFEKRTIIQIVNAANKQEPEPMLCNQLNLFNS
jgi:IS4 transposase